MNSDLEMLAAISNGYRAAAPRLEELRIKEIRRSDTANAIRSFELAFRSIIRSPMERKTFPLGKAQRIFLGVDV
ncbi:MAG: hypothetical protein AB7F88_13495 [Pyrinomonadaceae bacterium]